MTSTLARMEEVLDRSAVCGRIEAALPVGVRPRQLCVRTLLVAVLLALADRRPAHLIAFHRALLGLELADRVRLGVDVEWRRGPHALTYRQVERTFHLVTTALATDAELCEAVISALVEASVPDEHRDASRSYAVDWTDVESFSTRRPKANGAYADNDASWGHRKGGGPGEKDELFFGYYLQLVVMVRDDAGAAVPEVVRRMLLTSCATDPPPALVPVLEDMVGSGVGVTDVLCDSGYAHRVPEHWALRLRAMGATPVMDLHPGDRGRQGTHQGAVCCNGNLYCPSTPTALFDLGPLPMGATKDQMADHDRRADELAHYKLGVHSGPDPDGYRRMECPAQANKVRCPLVDRSMTLGYDRPEVHSPPEHPPTCCTQRTITVAPSVNAKTTQKHDYPSKAHRRSYARRTAAERGNSTIKDPATNDVARGWCRVMGLVPMSVLIACLLVVRNHRVLDAFSARQAEDARRIQQGLEPRTRRRSRQTLSDLVGAANALP